MRSVHTDEDEMNKVRTRHHEIEGVECLVPAHENVQVDIGGVEGGHVGVLRASQYVRFEN